MTAEQALVNAYRTAAIRLRVQIRAAIASGRLGTAAYKAAQLRSVQSTLRALGQRTRALPQAATFGPYVAGARAVDLSTGPGRVSFEFAGSHRSAAEELARALAGRVDDARGTVGRRTDDVFRRVALEELAAAAAAGDTRAEASASIEKRLVDEGAADALTGFVDKRGRRWQLDTYAEMVARTTTREAASAGTANRMVETGQLLVTISQHVGACDLCEPYQGRTWALPGHTVEGYPTIDRLPPFHPHCRHVAAPAAANLERFLAAFAAGG